MRRLNYIITLHARQGDYFFVPVIAFIKATIKETSDRSNTPNSIINDIVSYVLIRPTLDAWRGASASLRPAPFF